MAGKSTISITFKLDGDGKGFKELSRDADGLKTALGSALNEAQGFNKNAINFAAISTGIDQASSSLQSMLSTMSGLSAGYQSSAQQQSKLMTIMQQRMSANASDVAGINDVIKAQTELGVVGGTVQRSGAQQVATFLTQKESLTTLIPAMNNLIAQQKGINATQEDAQAIGNLLGKAMQGQTASLRRVGITFTAAQDKIMKYGTESQRAAMLSQIITQNVGNMNAELGKTDVGKQKQVENAIAGIKNKLGGLVQAGMPFVTIAAQSAIAAGGIIKLSLGIKTAALAISNFNLKGKAAAIGVAMLGAKQSQTAVITRIFSGAMTSGAYSAAAFKLAVRGLMISTGVGAAVAGLTMLIEHFVNSADSASSAAGAFGSAEEKVKEKAQEAEAARKAETDSVNQNKAALEINIQRLRTFKGTKEQEKKIVQEMNDAYGKTMGYFSSVSGWYNALTKNSEKYCRQMVLEAKTRILANQIANKEQETHDIVYDKDGNKRRYGTKNKLTQKAVGYSPSTGGTIYASVEQKGTSQLDNVNRRIKQNKREIKELNKQLNSAVKESASISYNVKGSDKEPTISSVGGGTTRAGKSDPVAEKKTRYQELTDLIEALKNKYIAASDVERKSINASINRYEKEKSKIELLQKQAERPVSLESLKDYDNEIQYQESLLSGASAEKAKLITKNIDKLNEERKAFSDAGHTELQNDQIKTYNQLNKEIDYYTNAINNADETERPILQRKIDDLSKIQKHWDDIRTDMTKPGDISTLNTIRDLDNAISYYDDLQKRQNADEIAGTEKVKDALEAKKKAMTFGVDLSDMQKEVDSVSHLSGKEFDVKVRSIGISELTEKINALKAKLNDLNNPPTSGQRKQIEGLIETYESWRKTTTSSFDTFKSGWEGVKGIGGGIENISNALKGNGDAWQSICGVIDGFIQIAEGINAIIGIINLLTTATTVHTAAKTAETAATIAETGATGANAAVTTAAAASNVAANTLEAASATTATTANVGLAASKTMAAHAHIPFVGIAIAAGAVASMIAIMKGLPKFANGGVISGPTLGLMGEYPGASHNPEVIAPLDKLRGMLKDNNVSVGGQLRVKGRDLVTVIANETRSTSKNTNIRI